MEGAHPIDDNMDNLQKFYDEGVRYIGLTWDNSNSFATSHVDRKRENGLTELGIKLINKMKDLGIIIDLAHSSEKTFWDCAKELGNDYPLVVTHTNSRSLCNFSKKY